ncbi:hypothetical protein Tco_0731646 [Tanacetum coccineum]
MACDLSLKLKLSTIIAENVLLKTQVESVANERENIKLEYQTLFNPIKATWSKYPKELNELIGNVNQKTYAYADVCAQNQDLLMTISKLNNKLKTVEKGKNMYTKFDKFETSGTLLCVTPLPKNITVKARKVSTSNVESSNSVRRPKSKDSKSKDRVLKNTKAKSSTTHVWKMSSSVSLDFNKCETMNSTSYHANKSVLNTKNVTVVNDEKSKNLGTTSVVAKSRLSVAKTPTRTTKVSSAKSLSPNSSQSRTLRNYMNNKIATSRKWQKWFEYKQSFNWSPKGKTVHSQSTVKKSITSVKTKSKTPVTTQKWVAKLSTLPSVSVSCNAGDPARPLDC